MPIPAAALLVSVGADTGPARRELSSFSRQLASSFSQSSAHANEFKRSLTGIGPILGGLGAGFVGLFAGGALIRGFAGVAREAFGAYMQTERLTTSLRSMSAMELVQSGQVADFGQALEMSGERAQELLEWMRQLAIKSPFSVQDIAPVMRLGMVFGFNSEQAKRLTTSVMNMSSALGFTGPDMERIIRALGQMNTRGKITNEELMQLAEVGVPALRILADAAGMTTGEFQKLVSKGMVDAGPAIEILVKGFEKYEGSADATAGTMTGLLASIQDIKEIVLTDFFSPMFSTVQGYLNEIVVDLQNPAIREFAKEWGSFLAQGVGTGLEAAVGYMTQIAETWERMQYLPGEVPTWVKVLGSLGGAEISVTQKDASQTGGTIDAHAKIVKVDWGPWTYSYETDSKITAVDWVDQLGNRSKFVYDAKAGVTEVQWKDDVFHYKYDADAEITTVEWGKGQFKYEYDATSAIRSVDWVDKVAGRRGFTYDAEAGITRVDWNYGGTGDGIDFSYQYDTQARVTKIFWGEDKTFTYDASGEITSLTWGDQTLTAGKNDTTFSMVIRATLGLDEISLGALSDRLAEMLDEAWANFWNKPAPEEGATPPGADWTKGGWMSDNLPEEIVTPVVLEPDLGLLEAVGIEWGSVPTTPDGTMTIFPQAEVGTIQPQITAGGPYNATVRLDVIAPRISSIYSGYGMGSSPDPWSMEYGIPGHASGTDFHPGGLAIVGEEGPELVMLPRGTRVIPNDLTKLLVPGYAEGTGNWIPLPAEFGDEKAFQTSVNAAAEKLGIEVGKAGDALTTGADGIKDAGKKFEDRVRTAVSEFESALRGVPGLFGSSQVTEEQMKLAELGVPQNFADDYLRRLTDEVVNKVDWADVDIKDAARAAGIDPNLPAEAILTLFRQSWENSSLFSNPENLKFINTDAVQKSIKSQKDSELGQENLMALFGVGDEDALAAVSGLGLQVATGLQQWLKDEGLGEVSLEMATSLGQGLSTSSAIGEGAVAGGENWMGTAEGQEAAKGWAEAIVSAVSPYVKIIPTIVTPGGIIDEGVTDIPPRGNLGPGGRSIPQFARGTGWFEGGLAWVGDDGPELLRLPRGTAVYDSKTSRKMAGGNTFIINAPNLDSPHMVELLVNRVVRKLKR